jgi:hypothetical protein
MKPEYLTPDEIIPGALFMAPSYKSGKLIPAIAVRLEDMSSTGCSGLYIRAIDAEGQSFLSNANFLLRA